jgi:hypothetical protein
MSGILQGGPETGLVIVAGSALAQPTKTEMQDVWAKRAKQTIDPVLAPSNSVSLALALALALARMDHKPRTGPRCGPRRRHREVAQQASVDLSTDVPRVSGRVHRLSVTSQQSGDT